MEKLSVECETSTAALGLDLTNRFTLLDGIVFSYTAIIAVFTVIFHATMPAPASILALHIFVLAAIVLLPPRGAQWETVPLPGWKGHVRGGLRFFRYSYPLLLILFYFEEGTQTVNAMWIDAPHWFENYLYAADRWLFGELPAITMNGWVGLVQDELMHGFYFSYYLILIGGVVIAWMGERGSPKPAPGFQTMLTSVILAFFLAILRGPSWAILPKNRLGRVVGQYVHSWVLVTTSWLGLRQLAWEARIREPCGTSCPSRNNRSTSCPTVAAISAVVREKPRSRVASPTSSRLSIP